MRKLYIILILTIFQFHLHSAQQDLCAEAKAKGFIFAADPSDCSSYLYCDTVTKITHRLKCDDKYPRFHNDTCWDADLDCISCPNLNKPIKYATDHCKSYALCMGNEDLGKGKCPGALNFDRNSGACVAEDLAPCPDVPPENSVNCENRANRYVIIPGTDCIDYTYCFNATATLGRWSCVIPGEVFDPSDDKQICIVKPHDYVCAEMEILDVSSLFINEIVPDYIPRAKNMRY